MDYGCGERRNKGKDKKRDKKKHPYKHGGARRSSGIDMTPKKAKE